MEASFGIAGWTSGLTAHHAFVSLAINGTGRHKRLSETPKRAEVCALDPGRKTMLNLPGFTLAFGNMAEEYSLPAGAAMKPW